MYKHSLSRLIKPSSRTSRPMMTTRLFNDRRRICPLHLDGSRDAVRTDVQSVVLFSLSYQYNTILGQVSPLSGSPEVLISFSVTLSHSVASYLISCRGVNPMSQGVCISSRSCTRFSLVTERPAAAKYIIEIGAIAQTKERRP